MAQSDSTGEPAFREIMIAATLEAAKAPEVEILGAVRACGFPEESAFGIKLALEEALINAVKHGCRHDSDKSIAVRYDINSERAIIVVRDCGCGFDPELVPDPTEPTRLTLPSGRGIMLMRAYMDVVEYRDNGREVYLLKHNK